MNQSSRPAYFFGSWGIAKFWPGIDLSVVADLASAVRFEDDAERERLILVAYAERYLEASPYALFDVYEGRLKPNQRDAWKVGFDAFELYGGSLEPRKTSLLAAGRCGRRGLDDLGRDDRGRDDRGHGRCGRRDVCHR